MKKIIIVVFALFAIGVTKSWADSPLTSCDFAEAYADEPMVALASTVKNGNMPKNLVDYLCDAKSPVDVRLAVINQLGWEDEMAFCNQLFDNLSRRHGVRDENSLAAKLDAGTLAVYAYAKAMGDYFNVTQALALARQAVKKDTNKSFSVALVAGLIDAQYQMDLEWGDVYKVVNKVLADTSLRVDMRLTAVNMIMAYINIYKEY